MSCINELLNQPPPQFSYCTDRACGDDVTINTDQSFLIGCDCTDGCRVSFKTYTCWEVLCGFSATSRDNLMYCPDMFVVEMYGV